MRGGGSIAEQLVQNRPDVRLGGGKEFEQTVKVAGALSPTVLQRALTNSYQIVTDAVGLVADITGKPILGAFAKTETNLECSPAGRQGRFPMATLAAYQGSRCEGAQLGSSSVVNRPAWMETAVTTTRNVETVRFAAGRSRTGPMTWAQVAGWNRIQREGRVFRNFGLARILSVAGCDLGAVIACVREIVERYEALRTQFPIAVGGTAPSQEVLGSGELDLRVVNVPSGDTAEISRHAQELADELKSCAADITRTGLTPFGAVVHQGVPCRLVIALSHFVADGAAMGVVTRELAALLAGESLADLSPGTWTPIDLAAYEQSPAGRRMNERAMAFWENHFRSSPPRIFGDVCVPESEERCVEVTMDSPALLAAASRITTRHQVSDVAVLVTAVCIVLHRRFGTDPCALELVAANRWHPLARHAVCFLAMHGPLLVEVAGGTFDELLPQVARASLGSHMYSHHDPVALDALLARVSRERGVAIERPSVVNHLPVAVLAPGGASPTDPRNLLSETRLRETDRREAGLIKLRLTAWDTGDLRQVSLAVDLRYFTEADVYETLRAIETAVVDAAVVSTAIPQQLAPRASLPKP